MMVFLETLLHLSGKTQPPPWAPQTERGPEQHLNLVKDHQWPMASHGTVKPIFHKNASA